MSSSHEGTGGTVTLRLTQPIINPTAVAVSLSVLRKDLSLLPATLIAVTSHVIVIILHFLFLILNFLFDQQFSRTHTTAYNYAPMPICAK